jgi:hypothetical protein
VSLAVESLAVCAGRLERVILGATQSPDFVALIASDYGCAWCSGGALAGSVSVDVQRMLCNASTVLLKPAPGARSLTQLEQILMIDA